MPRMQAGAAEKIRALGRCASATPGCAAAVDYARISQFKHLREIYAGSISTVYKGVCVASGAHVVVKVYHKAKMSPKQHHKLAREIDIQNRVKDCPFVCQLLATFEDANEACTFPALCACCPLLAGSLLSALLLPAEMLLWLLCEL
jgi:serine/threonine protein kinase